jgi:hypothetical protein
MNYGLNAWRTSILVLVKVRNLFLPHSVHKCSGAHSATYLTGTRHSVSVRHETVMQLHLVVRLSIHQNSIYLHGIVLNN